MSELRKQFDTYMGIKSTPNDREITLFERAKKYTAFLSYIPGVQMIAVVNSLSMYATHEDSDIDLFIVTRPGNIWFVRFFSTSLLFFLWVWRHGRDIAGNFCLSFFITTEAMDLSKIAIDNDIYLAHWISYMKPLYDVWGVYEAFMQANQWLLHLIDNNQIGDSKEWWWVKRMKHEIHWWYIRTGESEEDKVDLSKTRTEDALEYKMSESKTSSSFPGFLAGNPSERSPTKVLGDDREIQSQFTPETLSPFGHKSMEEKNTFGTFSHKSTAIFNSLIRHFLLPRTQKSYEKLGKPEWVIISDDILKFHDKDRRREIRDTILEKNFDK
jgi:hypothetical protein